MGIIMKDGHQYGIGGLERAEDISYDNTDSGMTATNVQGAVDELKSELTNNVIFNPTVSSSITDVQVRTCVGTYNPATKLVVIRMMLYSPSGNIPIAGGLIASIPSQYAPNIQTEVPALVIPNGTSWADVRAEAIMVMYDGTIRLGNYIYGNVATKWVGATIVYFAK